MEEDNVPLPKIIKWPFLVVDALLVVFALVIYFSVDKPLSPVIAFFVITAVAAGGFIACLPYYVEFRTLAKLKEYDLSQANTENARRIESALMGIQEIGEAMVQQTDRNAEIASAFESMLEQLEGRIGEIQTAEIAPPPPMDPDALREALREQLDAVRDDFVQAIAEQTAMTTDKQHDKLNTALNKLQGLPMQVSLLGELAVRYQSLVAMISDTAAQLIQGSPASGTTSSLKSLAEEDSFDGALEAEVEENVAPESAVSNLSGLRGEAEEEALDDLESADEEDAEATENLEDEIEALEEFDAELADDSDEQAESTEASGHASSEDEYVEDALEDDLLEEGPSDEPPMEAEGEPEFLSEAELADDEVKPVPAATEEVLEELEEDFDIALASEADDENAHSAELAEEGAQEAADDRREAAAEVAEEGMGFDDWDDFGEIGADEEGQEDQDQPAQAELIADVPEHPNPKAKKGKKGATTLIAQVLIGIGNKPYVRGVGPGLSETEGVPMEFLEIGKWQWIAPDSDEPVTVRVYKNDETPAEGDPIEIPAGQRRSIAPKFPG